jgi:hypothetical protein
VYSLRFRHSVSGLVGIVEDGRKATHEGEGYRDGVSGTSMQKFQPCTTTLPPTTVPGIDQLQGQRGLAVSEA